MTPDRFILVDLLHNPGSTEKQISHRVRDFSPHQVREGITRLTDAGHIRMRFDFFDITRSGYRQLCPGRSS